MASKFLFLILSFSISSIRGICNHYYQSSSISSTKRPFDVCYHSQITSDGPSSWRYFCNETTIEEFGNNSVTGFSAFREDFNTIDCKGTPNLTRIVNNPFRIFCASLPICETLRVRQYPIVNASECTYNASLYVEDIDVIALCDDNGDSSKAVFCNKKDENDGHGSYLWTNTYFNGQCEQNRLFEAEYQFHGCQGDGATYLEIMECDFNYQSVSDSVEPFNDGVFVAGFVLLLLAILCIVSILIWYCCWFRNGFVASRKGVSQRENHHDNSEDDELDAVDGMHGTSMAFNTTR